MKTSTLKQYSIPISIVIAGVLIMGAILFSYNSGGGLRNNDNSFGNNLSPTSNNVRPVNNTDHIKGNPNAEVTIIEYSDYECVFCKRIHPTLTQIIKDFDGEVRWIYRHFPLTSIHSRALNASIAGDCIAEIGGNDAFWMFTENIFNNQHKLGTELYESIATELNVPLDEFHTCQKDPAIVKNIGIDYKNAINSGGKGTPYIIVINKDGKTFPFSGALPYTQIKSIIEQALSS